MKPKMINVATHDISFHPQLQRDAVSVRKLNAVLGQNKSLYAKTMPAVFTEDGDGKLTLVARHWSYIEAWVLTRAGCEDVKTLVLVAENSQVNSLLDLDRKEISMMNAMKGERLPQEKNAPVKKADLRNAAEGLPDRAQHLLDGVDA